MYSRPNCRRCALIPSCTVVVKLIIIPLNRYHYSSISLNTPVAPISTTLPSTSCGSLCKRIERGWACIPSMSRYLSHSTFSVDIVISLTQATDTTNIRVVFYAVQQTTLRNTLENSELIWSAGFANCFFCFFRAHFLSFPRFSVEYCLAVVALLRLVSSFVSSLFYLFSLLFPCWWLSLRGGFEDGIAAIIAQYDLS